MNVGKMQAPGQQQHLQLHPAASSAAPPTQQLHLPIDYSLGNFKPAIAADFPGNPFVTSPQQQQSSTSSASASTSPSTVTSSSTASLQVRDLSALTSMAAIPSPTQLLHQRMQPAQITVDAHHHHQQQQPHQQQQHQMPTATTSPHDYAPMSAFKAVLPKKRNADGKQNKEKHSNLYKK